MHVHIHAGLQHHLLTQKLVKLRIKGNITKRTLHKTATHSPEPFDKLPGNTAYHQLVIVGEYTQRRNQTESRHTTQEAVLFHNCSLCATAGSRNCRYEAGSAASANNDIITAHDRNLFCNLYTLRFFIHIHFDTKINFVILLL